jgi:hypothetical protein
MIASYLIISGMSDSRCWRSQHNEGGGGMSHTEGLTNTLFLLLLIYRTDWLRDVVERERMEEKKRFGM